VSIRGALSKYGVGGIMGFDSIAFPFPLWFYIVKVKEGIYKNKTGEKLDKNSKERDYS